mmetsp:Transcript_18784/g.52480  ORF Transcript_18784/g.52480 Transcript_18784/m.52480 type:complete len:300 (+) Transcript_18784:134-1033(+)
MTTTEPVDGVAEVGVNDESTEHSEAQQTMIFDKVTEKGTENGLFQACMKSIRSAHLSANRLRAALVLSGLFTDKTVYREVIALFYVATNTMEKKIVAMREKEGDEICEKLLSLGYRFGPQYEKDLATLYDDDSGEHWKFAVEKVVAKATDGAKAYIRAIEKMSTGAELAGVAFCLWGALIIGGGAAAMPRVESLCGKEACHLFASVTGPGRGERKAKFIQLWDSLAVQLADNDDDSNKDKNNDTATDGNFERIIAVSKDCMQGNNELIISVKRNPWWLKYIASAAVALIAIGLSYYHGK